MKQILMNSNGAFVARVPRPAVQPGTVLVEVHYSLISTGTELAALRGSGAGGAGDYVVPPFIRRLPGYLHKAARNPGLAWQRLRQIGGVQAAAWRQRFTPAPAAPAAVTGLELPPSSLTADDKARTLTWSAQSGTVESAGECPRIVASGEPGHYQAGAEAVAARPGKGLEFDLRTVAAGANFEFGLLSADRSRWLANALLDRGECGITVLVDTAGEPFVWPMITLGAGEGEAVRTIDVSHAAVRTVPIEPGVSLNEMGDIGWNVGYSAAGRVVAVGEGVSGIRVGDLVACGGAGQANHAEVICVRRNLVAPVPRKCALDLAAMTTVGAIAMQGVRRADVRLGEVCCVTGLGLLGLITCELLRASGCRVIGVDLDPARVERARRLGVAHATTDIAQAIDTCRHLSGGHGADVTLVTAATKSDAPVNDAMKMTRRKGRVVIVGDVGLGIERAELYRKEIDVLISTSYGPGRYDPAYEIDGHDYPYAYVRWTQNRNMQAFLELAGSGAIELRALIDEVVPLGNARAVYARLAEGGGSIAVVIEYPPATGDKLAAQGDDAVITLRGHRAPKPGRTGYALVGAGAFGTSMLVPQMDKRSDRFDLRAVVSRDAVRGGTFARQRQLATVAADLAPVLERDDIDLVVIATRHDEHAQQAMDALAAGKHVFVEKPLALRWDELDQVQAAYQARPAGTLLMVGFNRRFAPAVIALRERLAGRIGPLVMNYRLNGGYIGPDSWIQQAQGGGRNLGEACHMYDLFRSLSGAPVVAVSAASIDPADSAYFVNDNFVATLTYADGSIGVLTYCANGPTQDLPKERIEVFCDGKGYVLDNFERLSAYPGNEVLWKGPVDKGHFEELSRFGDAIAAGADDGPIGFDEIVETSAVALHVEDLLQDRL